MENNNIKIALFSNFMNHHQLPLCLELEKLTKGKFAFVATSDLPNERKNMGYYDLNNKYDFIIRTYESKEAEKKAMEIALTSDVIIIGSAPEKYVSERIKNNKLTFRYSERIFKDGRINALNPRRYLALLRHHTKYINKPLYMLCASAYTASDFALAGAYLNKAYKWGYFPEAIEYDIKELLKKKKRSFPKLLWVGRFLKWKHPEEAVLVAKHLKNRNYKFELNIIGTGDMENELVDMINREKLSDVVNILGSMTPEGVREEMVKSNIFLFTSDSNEGWGAVVNEAMNSGCALIANRLAGSVPYMIKNGVNGYTYRKREELLKLTEEMISDMSITEEFGKKAYIDSVECWSPKVAAERVLLLAAELNEKKECVKFADGPCSLD